MKVDDFNYTLPEALIAQHPLPNRTDARMLVVERGSTALVDAGVRDLTDYLAPGDLMVFNNTQVIPARLMARKATGGEVEILIERVEDDHHVLAQLRVNRKPAIDSTLIIGDPQSPVTVQVLAREGEFWRLGVAGVGWSQVLIEHGHMPLPPYIQRPDEASDHERYQTVYGQVPGAVAAPTAGLHFDAALLDQLKDHGVEMGWCTLHVGAGTFQPVRTERIEDHTMHKEWLSVDAALVEQVKHAKAQGRRVIAVGTTAVRSLETAAQTGELRPYEGDSQLFIYPGFEFRVVDGMLTNFHLPGSTLVMLVAAFAGRERILDAYQHAIDQRYRFFSYGDATLLL